MAKCRRLQRNYTHLVATLDEHTITINGDRIIPNRTRSLIDAMKLNFTAFLSFTSRKSRYMTTTYATSASRMCGKCVDSTLSFWAQRTRSTAITPPINNETVQWTGKTQKHFLGMATKSPKLKGVSAPSAPRFSISNGGSSSTSRLPCSEIFYL